MFCSRQCRTSVCGRKIEKAPSLLNVGEEFEALKRGQRPCQDVMALANLDTLGDAIGKVAAVGQGNGLRLISEAVRMERSGTRESRAVAHPGFREAASGLRC